MAFMIYLRKMGEVPLEVEVTQSTLISELRTKHNLAGYQLSYKGARSGTVSMGDIGIQPSQTIYLVALRTGKVKAQQRMANGAQKTSRKYPNLQEAIMGETDVVCNLVTKGFGIVGGKLNTIEDGVVF